MNESIFQAGFGRGSDDLYFTLNSESETELDHQNNILAEIFASTGFPLQAETERLAPQTGDGATNLNYSLDKRFDGKFIPSSDNFAPVFSSTSLQDALFNSKNSSSSTSNQPSDSESYVQLLNHQSSQFGGTVCGNNDYTFASSSTKRKRESLDGGSNKFLKLAENFGGPVENENVSTAHEQLLKSQLDILKGTTKVLGKYSNGDPYPGTFTCLQCDELFGDKGSLDAHIVTQHSIGEKRLEEKCDYCPLTLKSKTNKKRHIDNCHKQKPGSVMVHCDVCNVCFTSKFCLQAHMRKFHLYDRNANGDPYVEVPCRKPTTKCFACQLCDVTFKEKNNLRRHVKAVHWKIFDFQCPICQKKVSTKNNLNVHIRKHEKKNK